MDRIGGNMCYDYCRIRKDLYSLGIPLEGVNGKIVYVKEQDNDMRYKWDEEDTFYILYKGTWYKAYSIDFDF